ncbi:MAG: 23S rRNA (pseudouridine(1915)-N(3))-methyltransferase RlmH [Gammaproteobacteria bacterium]|jgi:23S rRNA (pseudouridine1915-N3)-methyltransferase|nr:23S rRNA (pseudouridine(1915)-N(3))-methyltransferase RlmH [Gammaproteobacteria bacterium]
MSLTQKKIKIICPSHKLGNGEQMIVNHYQKCAARYGGFELCLVKPATGARSSKLFHEAEVIQAQIPTQAHVIALCEKGQNLNTRQLADRLFDQPYWCFIIGSSDGLCPTFIQKANTRLSLSALTFTHQMAICLIGEQIFRILSIYNNHPYHRD